MRDDQRVLRCHEPPGADPHAVVVWELRLEAHGILLPEMTTAVKPSEQRCTESCVVNGNGHCEA
jgi:hypothetical protein